jgi:hypothetical protein
VQHKFHLVAMAVANGETKECYKVLAEEVSKAYEQFYGERVEIYYTICDNVPHIREALRDTFPDAVTINCWAHLCVINCSAAGGLTKKASSREVIDKFVLMLKALHNVTDIAVFSAALDLLHTALEGMDELTLADHFLAQYGTEDSVQWSNACVAPGVPLTNNGLERSNKDFKEFGTNYETPSIDQLVNTIMPNYLHHRSREDSTFATSPKIVLDVWQAGIVLWESLQYQNATAIKTSGQEYVLLPSASLIDKMGDVVRKGDLKAALKEYKALMSQPKAYAKKHDFAAFMEVYESFYRIDALEDELQTEYVHFSCTCPYFWQHRVCKHVLAHGLGCGLFSVPIEVDPRLIGSKKCRGRPKLIRVPV